MKPETSSHVSKVDLTQPRDGYLIHMSKYSKKKGIGQDPILSILHVSRHWTLLKLDRPNRDSSDLRLLQLINV